MRSLLAAAVLLAACGSERRVDHQFRAAATTDHAWLDGVIGRSRFDATHSARGATLAAFVARERGHQVRLEIAGGGSMTWSLITTSAAPPLRMGGAVLVKSVAPSTDLVHTFDGISYEDTRILRGPAAPTVARYAIAWKTPLAALRTHGDRLVLANEGGAPRLMMSAPFAVDARGVRRAARMVAHDLGPDRAEVEIALDPTGLTFPIAIDPVWTALPTMTVTRGSHGLHVLPSGKVLAAPADNGSTAEIFDPATSAWSSTVLPAQARVSAKSITLADGKVLVFGTTTAKVGTTALFDEATLQWTAGASDDGRGQHAMVVLADGRILVTGGEWDCNARAAAIYDAVNDSWSSAATPASVRVGHTATVLSDHRVLLVGGYCNTMTNASPTEIYDPATNTFTLAASLSAHRRYHVAAALPDGRVLVAGGNSATLGHLSSAEIYDPIANTWTSAGTLRLAVQEPSIAALGDGRFLVTGGRDGTGRTTTFADVFLASAATWLPASPMIVPRVNHAMVGLPGGRALISGGYVLTGAGQPQEQSTAELFTSIPNGGVCTLRADCASGFCVEGVCCTSACDLPCQACNEPGSAGTCLPVNGSPRSGRTCPLYACFVGQCLTSCAADGDCDDASYCKSSVCVARQATAAACTTKRQCASDACVDGVCCDVACAGTCEACDVSGKVGTCVAVQGAPRGARACTGVVGSSCGATCDGVERASCKYPSTSTLCSASGCANGVETRASTCDGAGKCKDEPRTCAPFGCGVDACRTTCATTSECAPGFACKGTTCIGSAAKGDACSAAVPCGSGLTCFEGVCCASPSCPAGSTCGGASARGTCTKHAGQPCADHAECGTGFCVDGVCCDTACTGSCEGCAESGATGICSAVSGEPRGLRTKCEQGGAAPCLTRLCDGAQRMTCSAFAGAETSCGAAVCDGATFASPRLCDGTGTCAAASTTQCTPFACATDGCKTACSTSAHCAGGFRCLGSSCIPTDATCSEDGSEAIARDGTRTTCSPYRCRGGVCLARCASDGDCATAHACAGNDCVVPSSTEASEGCGYAGRTRHRAVEWLVTAMTIGALLRRRERRRRWIDTSGR